MKTLIEFAKELGATKLDKVNGPNGAFISITLSDESRNSLPVGKRSQNGKLIDYNILTTEDGVNIATINNYKTIETVTL